MPEPTPVILEGSLSINDVALDCLLSHVELLPDTSTIEVKTMCGVVDYPGTVKWSLKASLYQSFDPDGTEEVLSEAVAGGVPVPFIAYTKRGEPISTTNPAWTGDVVPQDYAPIIGDAGDAISIDIEWSLVAAPVKIVVPPIAADAAAAKGSTKATADV